MSLQGSELEQGGLVTSRVATTIGLSYDAEHLRWGTKLEYREDENQAGNYVQWLTSNALEAGFGDDWRLVGKLNYSHTEDASSGDRAARFVEGSFGFAYRPTLHDRWNVLGRYTYLYDLVAPDQIVNRPDQLAQVVSFEALYDLTKRLEIGAKVAARRSEMRVRRDAGRWFDNGANLLVLRGRYHAARAWDVLLEYRVLETVVVDDARNGWLFGIYRHLGDRFKVGVGYNFTSYSDDLTDLDYDSQGWFADIVGKW